MRRGWCHSDRWSCRSGQHAFPRNTRGSSRQPLCRVLCDASFDADPPSTSLFLDAFAPPASGRKVRHNNFLVSTWCVLQATLVAVVRPGSVTVMLCGRQHSPEHWLVPCFSTTDNFVVLQVLRSSHVFWRVSVLSLPPDQQSADKQRWSLWNPRGTCGLVAKHNHSDSWFTARCVPRLEQYLPAERPRSTAMGRAVDRNIPHRCSGGRGSYRSGDGFLMSHSCTSDSDAMEI